MAREFSKGRPREQVRWVCVCVEVLCGSPLWSITRLPHHHHTHTPPSLSPTQATSPFSPSCSPLTHVSLPVFQRLSAGHKSDQIAHFHVKELNPNKGHGSGEQLQTPNTLRSLEQMEPQCRRMEEKRETRARIGEGGWGRSKDIFIYVKENANMSREE